MDHLKVYGFKVRNKLKNPERRGKLDPKSKTCVVIEYPDTLWNKNHSMNVAFGEDCFHSMEREQDDNGIEKEKDVVTKL